MPQRRRHPAPDRKNATSRFPVPRPRGDAHDRAELLEPAERGAGREGGTLVAHPVTAPAAAAGRRVRPRLPSLPRVLPGGSRARDIASDVAAALVAALDVWLVVPEGAAAYSTWLSWAAVGAMLLRRHVPFLAVLCTIPGFFVGWAQLAAMIALGTLAKRHLMSWRTAVGAVLVGLCRFVLWPWSDFLALTWREHFLDALYGVLVAGMPVAIGMLITVRQELSTRIQELARSREREKRLHAQAVRSAERAKLAREMHDVVSHQVTLIAMQAGALQVATADEESREAAATIRALSTRTLEELRELVGVLRSGGDEEETQPGLEDLDPLLGECAVAVTRVVDVDLPRLPAPVSRAAYRTVQEALTNVRKHAPGARATVRVRQVDGTLVVEIRNDRPRKLATSLPSGGHGLVGLRERATLLGGSFDATATPDGGYLVVARYPIA